MNIESSKKYGSWSGLEIEEFFEQTRIPLRLSLMTKNGLLIVPLWFEYNAGSFFSCSPDRSLLVTSLRDNPDVAFDLSSNDIPYRGVRGRGTAQCSIAKDKVALENLLERYLAGTNSSLANMLLGRSSPEAIIEVQLSWLTSWDFSSRMTGE